MTRKEIIEIRRNHRTTVAKYTALAIENASKKKCLVTFPSSDKTYEHLNIIRKEFVHKVNSLLKRKNYEGKKWANFSVIEFGSNFKKHFNPHLHIQCYYEDIELIQEAFEYVIKKLSLDQEKCDLKQAYNNRACFDYIIKTYQPTNTYYALEEFKRKNYKGKPLYWSSHKLTPNYVIKRLYQKLRELPIWKEYKNKYKLILDLIDKGVIQIKKIGKAIEAGFERVGDWMYIVLDSPKTVPSKIEEEINIKNTEEGVDDRDKETSTKISKQKESKLDEAPCQYSLTGLMERFRRKLLKITRWIKHCSKVVLLLLKGEAKIRIVMRE